MSQDFQRSIREWVSLDNQLKQLNEQVKELRSKRTDLTKSIMTMSAKEGYENATINISDGSLRFGEVRSYASLSLKYVYDCLKACLKDETQIEKVMEYIKENRPIKETKEIKRTINK